ncbi:hypothetical protein HK405_008973, partial [Cladochytrium tenue]
MAANNNILFIVTSHDQLGSTGKKTGYYLPEMAHPYNILTRAGFAITVASPLGGAPPVDPASVTAFAEDAECN